MMLIFIDTGAFLSRHMENDQFYSLSVKTWKELEKQNTRFFTSNFILNETLTLFGRRAGGKLAKDLANSLYDSNLLHILRPDEQDEREAIKLIAKFSNHQVGFTDCLSCVLMHRYDITNVFSFDQQFQLWKFKMIPTLSVKD